MDLKEGNEAVKEAKDFISKQKPDLVITDVPRQTLKDFKGFANSDEFKCGGNDGGHWGFALKFLLDFYLGRIIDGSAVAEAKAEEALAQIAELRTAPEEQEKKVIKLINGKELK